MLAKKYDFDVCLWHAISRDPIPCLITMPTGSLMDRWELQPSPLFPADSNKLVLALLLLNGRHHAWTPYSQIYLETQSTDCEQLNG